MKLHFLILPILACLAACGPSKPPAEHVQYFDHLPDEFQVVGGTAGPDDIGLFLAGMPVRHGTALSKLQQSMEYQTHHREMEALWPYARTRMRTMRTWSEAEVTPAIAASGTVLYPFGGPDLLHVCAMFPQARSYALMGLEPVGAVPPLEQMPPGEVLGVLAAFRQAMQTQMMAGYFITKDMHAELEHSELRGVTPILLATVALIGGHVESVNGTAAGGKPAVEMRFRDDTGLRHSALYLAGDLSNRGFDTGYRQFLAGLGGSVTYFKAASYLMHDDRFSHARDFFLTQSRAILQDDSGIPFRYFAQGWALRFYGNYQQPIALFAKHQQDDLRRAYAMNPRSPLEFGSGYEVNQWQGNLLLTIRR